VRFLLDEHLRGPLRSAIQRHGARGQWPLDVASVGDFDDLPLGLPDPDILLWAERGDYPLVSRDKSTLPDHLRKHLEGGHHSPGVLLLSRHASVADVIEFLTLVAYASEAAEWKDAKPETLWPHGDDLIAISDGSQHWIGRRPPPSNSGGYMSPLPALA
jgi:hypothetical protein